MNQGSIAVTRASLERLLALYKSVLSAGLRRGDDTIVFDGAELRLDYVEYLIEFLAISLGDDSLELKASHLKNIRKGGVCVN